MPKKRDDIDDKGAEETNKMNKDETRPELLAKLRALNLELQGETI